MSNEPGPSQQSGHSVMYHHLIALESCMSKPTDLKSRDEEKQPRRAYKVQVVPLLEYTQQHWVMSQLAVWPEPSDLTKLYIDRQIMTL